MNEPIKKQPVDELFARKLATLSLSPDRQGFARLQARIEQKKQPEKVVFWRTPTFQRSVASAACLALLATLGWNKQSTNNSVEITANTQKTIARNAQPVHSIEQTKPDVSEAVADLTIPGKLADNASRDKNNGSRQLADDEKRVVELARVPKSRVGMAKAGASVAESPVNEVIERTNNDEEIASTRSTTGKENVTNTASAAAPRTLVVTIAEPDVLVAAKQTAQEADQKLVVVNKNTNETGAGKLWRKIQQIRTGEASVANAPTDEDEKGLLDRAYGQLKQSIQKNKTARQ